MTEERWISVRRIAIGFGIITILMVAALMVTFDAGYRAGSNDTEQDPTPLRVSTMIISLNASQYNQTWYEIGGGYELSEELQNPTCYNDSFLIFVDVHWGSSDTFGGQFGAPIPHANVTVEVLPFGYGWHNYTIERVAISGRNRTESRKMINLYNNTAGRMHATDSVSMAFFGYGSYNPELVFWVVRNIILTVGPVWHEEIS